MSIILILALCGCGRSPGHNGSSGDVDGGLTCSEIALLFTEYEQQHNRCQRDYDCRTYGTYRVEGRDCHMFVVADTDYAPISALRELYDDCWMWCAPAGCPCTAIVGTVCSEGRCAEAIPCGLESSHSAVVYSGERDTCGPGQNCFGALGLDGRYTEGYPDSYLCRSVDEVLTCSMLTHQLLSDPSRRCADAMANGRCQFGLLPDGTLSNASLIGVCAPAPSPVLAIWDPCNPVDTHACPNGAACASEDASGLGSARCVPYCDVAHHDGVLGTCEQLGAPAGAKCHSVGVVYEIAFESPLGQCLL